MLKLMMLVVTGMKNIYFVFEIFDENFCRCEVTFPRAPEAGTQESSFDLRLDGGASHGGDYGHQGGNYGQQGGDYGQQSGYVEVTVDPTEATVGQGEKITVTCNVKGAERYTIKWGKYAHDTSLPDYIRVCNKN